METIRFQVGSDDAGKRLDVVLVRRVAGMSRARARDWTGRGLVRVNDRRAKKSHVLVEGDRVVVQEPPDTAEVVAEPDPDVVLDIVLEDEGFVVVDKPAGTPSHPLLAGERGTLANGLVARYPEMRGVGYSAREPGIVHRLDNETSGLMIAARDKVHFDALREQLTQGEIDKRYLVLCLGKVLAPQEIDLPISNEPGSRPRVRVGAGNKARPAFTEVLTSKPVGALSLVEVRARTAQRHQVRAHLGAVGHPLAADTLYGGGPIEGLTRFLLHASRLLFVHPRTQQPLDVTAKLPASITAMLRDS